MPDWDPKCFTWRTAYAFPLDGDALPKNEFVCAGDFGRVFHVIFLFAHEVYPAYPLLIDIA